MKAEHWVVAAGIAFAILVLVGAMIPEDALDGSPAAVTGLVQGAGTNAAAPVAEAPQQQNTATGLVPFSRAKTGRFEGKVVRIVSLGSSTGWGQLHIWIDEGAGGPAKEVSIAPDWYLMHMGCAVKERSRVNGTVFSFGNARPDPEYYAKNITIDGRTCDLRNDEGFALWSNRLR